MDRRRFLLTSLAGACGFLPPRSTEGQQPPKNARRVAFLCLDSCTSLPAAVYPADEAFLRRLAQAGYNVGLGVQIDSTGVGVGVDQVHVRAAGRVDRQAAVIVAAGTLPTEAARQATKTIPIVMM